MHESGQSGAGAYEYGVIAFFGQQGVNGGGLADDTVGLDLYAQGLDILDLFLDDALLGKTEFGNTVDQNAACLVQGFKDLDIIAHFGQIAGAGQAGRTGADDGDLFALLLRRALGLDAHFPGGIGHVTLQLADGDRLALDAPDALAFALGLLRTYTSADGRQGGGFADDIVSGLHVAFFYLRDKAGDIDRYGASLHAAGVLAVQAAKGFFFRLFFIVSQTYFFKIGGTHLGVLLPDRDLFHHIHCHFKIPFLRMGLRKPSVRSCLENTISRNFRSRRGGCRLLWLPDTVCPLPSYTVSYAAWPVRNRPDGRRIQDRLRRRI